MTPFNQAIPVRVPQTAVDTEQPFAEDSGSSGAFRSLVPHPDRYPVLHGARSHDLPQASKLARTPVGGAVATGQVGTEEFELGDAVAGADPEVDTTIAELVDDCDLLG